MRAQVRSGQFRTCQTWKQLAITLVAMMMTRAQHQKQYGSSIGKRDKHVVCGSCGSGSDG